MKSLPALRLLVRTHSRSIYNMPTYRALTLEEHFLSTTAAESPSAPKDPILTHLPQLKAKLLDLHETRIENMKANGVGLQILSHLPNNLLTVEEVRAANDEIASKVAENPHHLRAFAQLPMGHPKDAARELARCVKDLGMPGALIDNHHEGIFFDESDYECFWEMAEKLDVPIYIHPTFPSDPMTEAFFSGGSMDDKSSFALGTFVFGWHFSTGVTFLRLLATGVFDRHPRLKIVLGHAGELLPYMFARVDGASGRAFNVKRGFAQVMRENVWITTSGVFDVHSLRCLLGVMPHDRIMFSVDYPFSDNGLGSDYLKRIQEEQIMTDQQLDAFVAENAARLLFKGQAAEILETLRVPT